MRFHPAVQADLKRALAYFDCEGGQKLGDRFFAELAATLERIAARPKRYGFWKRDLRRSPIRVFRYHVVYRIHASGVRILVLRHTRQHPGFGLSRR